MEQDEEWLVIHVTGEHRRFWTGDDWTLDIESAKTYPKFGDTFRVIWGLDKWDLKEGRLTSIKKEDYLEFMKSLS